MKVFHIERYLSDWRHCLLKLSESAGRKLRIEARRVSTLGRIRALLVVDRVSKRYEIYERPQDRLKQSIVPRLQTLLARRPAPVAAIFQGILGA